MFPEDIWFNIFTRLPAKSIGRFRCVSNPWRLLLTDPQFINSHRDRAKKFAGNDSLVLVSSNSYRLYTAPIARHKFDEMTAVVTELSFVVEGYFAMQGMPTCDGLVFIKEEESKKMILFNPTTREFRQLPDLPVDEPDGNIYGLGYDCVLDDYKVVRLSCNFSRTLKGVHVYSIRSGEWRSIESYPRDCVMGLDNGVFVEGFIYWTTMFKPTGVLMGFDLVHERFVEVPMPIERDAMNYMRHKLGVHGGYLSLVRMIEGTGIDVWVMKECDNKDSWTKFSIIDPNASEESPPIFLSRQLEILVLEGENVVLHNVDGKRFKRMTLQGVIDGYHTGASFMENLVSPYV